MIDDEILARAERAARSVDLPDGRLEELFRRHERKRRNQRITGGAVGMGIFVALVWFVTSAGLLDRTQTPVTPEGADTGHVSPTGGAAAGSRGTTRVTIHAKSVPSGAARLWGIVESERPLRCARGREVVVYREEGKTDWDVGHDIAFVNVSGDSYKWSLTLYGPDALFATYYARVRRTESCRADLSGTVVVRIGGG